MMAWRHGPRPMRSSLSLLVPCMQSAWERGLKKGWEDHGAMPLSLSLLTKDCHQLLECCSLRRRLSPQVVFSKEEQRNSL